MNYHVKVPNCGTAEVDAKDPTSAAIKAVIELERHNAWGDYTCAVEQYDDAWTVVVRVDIKAEPAVCVRLEGVAP